MKSAQKNNSTGTALLFKECYPLEVHRHDCRWQWCCITNFVLQCQTIEAGIQSPANWENEKNQLWKMK